MARRVCDLWTFCRSCAVCRHGDGGRRAGLSLARRPTGGGFIFHTCDYAFSVLIGCDSEAYRSNTLEERRCIADHWRGDVVGKVFNVHLEIDEIGCPRTISLWTASAWHSRLDDLVVQGRKVGGAAQRRTRQGVLHEGSICLTLPPKEYLKRVVLDGTLLADAMHTNSFPLLGQSVAAKSSMKPVKPLKRQ